MSLSNVESALIKAFVDARLFSFLKVSGAGSAAVNGFYFENGTFQGSPRYVGGTADAYEIVFPIVGGAWLLQRISDAAYFYFGTGGDSTGPETATAWAENEDFGALPAPVVAIDLSKIQFENIAFTPPNGEAWAGVYFLPSQPDVSTLGKQGTDRFDGVFQIDLNFPQNAGTKPAKDKAEAVRNAFTTGKRFSYSGQEVVISSCGRSQGRPVNGFYRIAMSVVFYAHVIRNN